jgi:hypothetical protein
MTSIIQGEVLDPTIPREVINYALQRRSSVQAWKTGRVLKTDLCDADPYLKKAAHFHGVTTSRICPVCEIVDLIEISYVFGKELGPFSGRIKSPHELLRMSKEHGQIKVFVVEVCQGCSWNHVYSSYVLGDGKTRRPLKKPADWLD